MSETPGTGTQRPAELPSEPVSEWRRRWIRFRRNPMAVTGLAIVVAVALLAVCAPLISPYGFADMDRGNELAPNFSPGHLMGTDSLGRDVFSRLVYSVRTALFIAVAAELISLAVAFAVGLTAAYRGGKVDQILMAGTDVMYAFPSYLFAVLMVAIFGRSTLAVILALSVASWVGQSRLIRAQILRLKTLEYVEAGRAMGARGWRLVTGYMVPNAMGPILVTTAFGIPGNMLAESGLAILGLGVAPPTPSLGTMIIDGYRFVVSTPSLIMWPVLLFVLTMLAFTWVGDGIRDAFDVDES